MKYPSYSKSEALNCKITEENIEEIKTLRKEGYSVAELSKKFDVSTHTIYYWLKTDEERKLLNYRPERNRRTPEQRAINRKTKKKSIDRKILLMGDDYYQYKREWHKRVGSENRRKKMGWKPRKKKICES